MNILVNKSNLTIIETETEIHCFSYNTLVGIYNKIMNNYKLIEYYKGADGTIKKMSKTSRKHQNIFKTYIPNNAEKIE